MQKFGKADTVIDHDDIEPKGFEEDLDSKDSRMFLAEQETLAKQEHLRDIDRAFELFYLRP